MESSKKKRSLPYKMGELKAHKFTNKLLLKYAHIGAKNQKVAPPEKSIDSTAIVKHDSSTYQRLAEVESELVTARRFIDSLHQSRAYRLMMRILRLLGRVK